MPDRAYSWIRRREVCEVFESGKRRSPSARISSNKMGLAPRLGEANAKTGTGKKRADVLREAEAAAFETSNVYDEDTFLRFASPTHTVY